MALLCRQAPAAMRFVSFPASQLSISDVNPKAIDAKYAVRGKIPIRADELKEMLENSDDHNLPFDRIILANIGNPQQLDQKPLTWYRQVLCLLQYPTLLHNPPSDFPADVVERAKTLHSNVGSLGAYSHSQGAIHIRKSVAKFIEERDGLEFPANPKDIFLTSGASAAVQYLLQLFSNSPKLSYLIPIPQYPLYTATITLNNARPIGYFLDESNHWSTDPAEIRQLIKENADFDIKALVVINPGNPTGAILAREDIVEICKIAAENGIVVIADEVYQENVFKGEFISVRKVLKELQRDFPGKYDKVQLASLHSTSKGVSGECGQRGGYMELVGFKPEVQDVIFKLALINLCSVVLGQVLMELMINPPKKGDPSYELYHKETQGIHKDLMHRATQLYKSFLEMEDIECNKPMGAMYLFPSLKFTKEKYPKLFEEAEKTGAIIDEVYCIELLENTGICCVPGSGFGQKPDTYHVRTTFLPPGDEWIKRWNKFHADFVAKYTS